MARICSFIRNTIMERQPNSSVVWHVETSTVITIIFRAHALLSDGKATDSKR